MSKNYEIQSASFKEQRQLMVSIEKALLKQKLKLADINIDIKDLTKIDLNSIDMIMQIVFAIDSDNDFEEALFKCLARCLYNGEKITYDIFENEEAKKDYYNIVIECIKKNLTPFFYPLLSKLSEIWEININPQKQK